MTASYTPKSEWPTPYVRSSALIYPASVRNSAPDPLDQRWREQADCMDADPDLFFPEDEFAERAAKRICSTCPVLLDCLRFAEATNPEGVWAGETQADRRQRRRRAARVARETREAVPA